MDSFWLQKVNEITSYIFKQTICQLKLSLLKLHGALAEHSTAFFFFGLEDSSVDTVLPLNAWGPEFDTQSPNNSCLCDVYV